MCEATKIYNIKFRVLQHIVDIKLTVYITYIWLQNLSSALPLPPQIQSFPSRILHEKIYPNLVLKLVELVLVAILTIPS